MADFSRSFDGNDSIVVSAGTLSTWTYGTWFAVMKRNSTGYNGIVNAHNASVQVIGGLEVMGSFDGHHLGYMGHNTSRQSALSIQNSDGWVLIAASKATGSQVCRFHKYRFSDATWTHENSDSALADGSQTVSTVRFGIWEGSDFFNGLLASAGVWRQTVLSDASIETLIAGLSAAMVLNPTALWGFNQSSIATPVSDLTGHGANETSIVGTATSSDVPAGYNFALSSFPPGMFLPFFR